ncbi:PqqD family protein [Bacteriovorax sp. DB6_IX]|uniref:PqqD family protein n=1 Tax=Bacteriovorax sp. DB6_IX TaxID=1353530 RepID=UPI00038A4D6A|nr:PqqD family protein [Bacteriovorax sp. DB6_IX]EQC52425.1 PqqD family protein [Bacteriovorax sp. DB6_IX]
MSEINKQYPQKKGLLVKQNEAGFVLVNDNGKSYATNEVIRDIWQLSDGTKSVDSIIQVTKSHHQSASVEAIESIFVKLSMADLISL